MDWRLDIAALGAKNSLMKQHKIGALVMLKGGGSIAGWNKKKTHPRFQTRSIHAEMDCILKAARGGHSLGGATIYVARQTRDGRPALAKPCPTCMSLLHEAGVRRVVWTTDGSPGEFIL